jgi:hypothetical protein
MARVPRFNPPVLLHKTAFLQRIQEAVGNGYQHYALGEVPTARALPLVLKFVDRYRIDADKSVRHLRKTKGLGNARLVLYSPEPTCVEFALLVTRGQNPAHDLERLADESNSPVAYREFELVRLTGKGREKPSLTWRWNADTMRAWRERLHMHTASYDKLGLYQDFFSLYRSPGFAGIRRQVGELVAGWRRDWEKLRGQAPCPVCYPHDEFRFRAIPGVTKGEDGYYWPAKGFPNMRQLPTLFYVRKYVSPSEPMSKFVASALEVLNERST